MAKTETPEREPRFISRDRIQASRSAHTEWCVTVPAGTEPEDLLKPEYWKHVVVEMKFSAGDSEGRVADDIIAICEDRSWRAHFEVRDVGPYHCTLALLAPDKGGVFRYSSKIVDLPLATDTHYVKWINIGTKYTVRRKSDDEIIEKGFKTPQTAAAWMAKHVKKIAA